MAEETPSTSSGGASRYVTIDVEANTKISQPTSYARPQRSGTNLDEVLIESRPFKHSHIIRRPRPLQYYNPEDGLPLLIEKNTSRSETKDENENGEERSTDNLLKQLNRVDLFIDLVWVGIIANLSHTFGEQAFSDSGVGIGTAFLEFILLFIPIWRLWDHLRSFGSNFYNDDLLQRQFMCWILVLAVLYGVNAPYAFRPDSEGNSLTLLITTYLIARASFLGAHGVQSIYMPFLRRQFLFILAETVITAGLWIPAIWVHYPAKIALLVLANVVEDPFDIFIASPLGDRLITGGWKKTVHFDHYIERHEGFFIIILGEGVFRLIYGSPSGMGLNEAAGTVLTVLLLFYMIHWLYFNGDQAKEFVHALRRTWWRRVLWRISHVSLFGALLVLAASTLFLVQHQDEDVISTSSIRSTTESSAIEPSPPSSPYLLTALWTSSISLSVVLLYMTFIALLNRPLDKPKTLVVNSRWVRLAPRLPGIAIIACLPLFDAIKGSRWCAGALVVLWALFLWEWIAGLERGWEFFEGRDE